VTKLECLRGDEQSLYTAVNCVRIRTWAIRAAFPGWSARGFYIADSHSCVIAGVLPVAAGMTGPSGTVIACVMPMAAGMSAPSKCLGDGLGLWLAGSLTAGKMTASAALAVSAASLVSGWRVKPNVAITGSITLRLPGA
jgi:hypothetical protein